MTVLHAIVGILKEPFRRYSWNRLSLIEMPFGWQHVTSVSATLYSLFIVKLPWVVAIGVVATILVRGLTQQTTVIEPISSPKALADEGYTSEVAGRRLRDAIVNYSAGTRTHMKNPEIALHGELPNIVVPSVGISLDAVVSSIRTLLHSTRSRTITGELTIKGKLLWLHLRLDGLALKPNCNRTPLVEFDRLLCNGAPIEEPDRLLAAAAPLVLNEIQPYRVAVSLADENPDRALEKTDEIIKRLPESDPNVAWSYNLRGNILLDRKDYSAAVAAFNKALSLDPYLAVAHNNLGNVYKNQGQKERAIDAYREAIRLDPKFATAHYNLGIVVPDPKEKEAAYREAIKLDPKHVSAINNLGFALEEQGRREEAIAAYKSALEIDPNHERARRNLARLMGG